jgi:CheY-like chemotaxis protein
MAVQEPAMNRLALLAEGDAEIEATLRKMLEPHGWEIVITASGEDALEQVKVRQFELIVTAGHTRSRE